MHGFSQHLRYLASSVTEHPVDEYTLIDVFTNGLVDGPVKTYMFREEFNALDKAIAYDVQEDVSLRQVQANKSTYRPVRRQEHGGPEPIDLCYVESDRPRSQDHNRTARCHRCQKIGHYQYECSVPGNDSRPKSGRGDRR